MSPDDARHDRRITLGLQASVRARITIAVALVALLLSGALTATTLAVARRTLIADREEALARRAAANAATVADGVASSADLQSLLSSLPDAGKPTIVAIDPETDRVTTASRDPDLSADALPEALRRRVLSAQESGIMRFRVDDRTYVAAGLPIGARQGYFEAADLGDIAAGLRTLALTLIAACAATTLLGALLGYWASRYAIQPLTRIAEAAEDVAGGRLDARIDYTEFAGDPDLAPLVANFNAMVSAFETRIERDARFASDVSHELRSPLTTLNASIEVLRNNHDELPERAQQALDLLTSDMQRFTQLVEDLLEISRFDAGAVRLELEAVALAPTVENAVRSMASRFVPVETDEAVANTVLVCDKRRLLRILANFLDNAEKYGGGATGVSISLIEPTPSDDDADADEAPLPTVQICVDDEGPGVAEAEREQIFDRFNRGSQGGSRGGDSGVGLGLALADEHARLQGGRVWAESRPDGLPGARFVLELPFVEPVEDDGDDELEDLAAVTPEEAVVYALTGELPAIVVDDGPERQ
ncbi:MAG: ATP-binding protein [Actinomycetes bacterium]